MYYFVASDYFATGEGRTVSLLITMAQAKPEHYSIEPEIGIVDNKMVFKEGVLKISKEQIALEEMNKKIDPYFAACSEVLDEEKFFSLYASMIPEAVKKMVCDNKMKPYLNWFQELHFNYS